MDMSKRSIQFDLEDDKSLDVLFDLMRELSRNSRERVGLGTAVRELVMRLLARPHLIAQLFDDAPHVGESPPVSQEKKRSFR